MSTNYYATKTEVILEQLDANGLSVTVSKTTGIHIGKSSGDFAFKLHIYPKLGINTEADMLKALKSEGWKIDSDLYGAIDLDTLKEDMKLQPPVRRGGHREGNSKNCDYYTGSFC